MHLTMRLSCIERRYALEGAGAVSSLLHAIVDRIGMRVLAGPLVGEENGDPMHRGYSGVIILYESHTAIHTYPDLGEAFLDIFSCRPYDAEMVGDVLREYLGSYTVVEQSVFDRGIHWGANVEREVVSWMATRSPG
jgi:S-adenosylmethionine decarboxylase